MSLCWWFRGHFSHVITSIDFCLFYQVSFIFVETDLYLRWLSDCEQPSLWPLLRKKTIILLCTFHEFHIYLKATSTKCFWQVFKGLKYYIFFKKNCIFPKRSHFSAYRATLKKQEIMKNTSCLDISILTVIGISASAFSKN